MRRLEEGFVLTKNPRNMSRITRVPLSPECVDCIVFWTKDAQNCLDLLPAVDAMGYMYYFQFTVTPYDRTAEKNVRDKADIIRTFAELCGLVGRERIVWRYDPVIVNETFSVAYHKTRFRELCERLHEYTECVIFSFVDMYQCVKTDIIRAVAEEEQRDLTDYIGRTAAGYGLSAYACCENISPGCDTVSRAECISGKLIQKLTGCNFNFSAARYQRPGCLCRESTDIGIYNTCTHGCVYCYASYDSEQLKTNLQNIREDSGLLTGVPGPYDTVTPAEGCSGRTPQIELF